MTKHRINLTLSAVALLQLAVPLQPLSAAPAANLPGLPQQTEQTTGTKAAAPVGFKTIKNVEAILVEAPAGTVPQLPYRVWTTYSDGSAEFRQTRWSNSSPTSERAEANAQINPAGSEYTIKGFIIGDNTTPNGYPIEARIRVTAGPGQAPARKPVAETVPLNKVRVEGQNRLTSNRELAIRTICSWDVKQQLYNYRDTYGLSTEGYPVADGWDSPTTKLKGHGSGHYMSALAFAFASTQDPEQKEILRNNMREMVNTLRECQELTFVWDEKLGRYWEARDFAPEEELRNLKGTWADFDQYKKDCKKYGYGYINAIPAQHAALIEMYRGYNNENWVWAPYYSIHKQLAGLIDIATYVDDPAIADKALLVAKDMGLWVWNRMHYRTYVKTDGTKEERRAKPGNRYEMWNMYIAGEVGGMSESLARLSEMVKDPTEKERLLQAATYFDSPAFYDPLSKNVDDIRTRHANQHIPMIVGSLRIFRGNRNPYYYNVSENFWNMIQGRYRYSPGGVGNGEMFRQPYSQILSMATNVTSDREGNLYPSPTINETCCAYNLAKLTKDLNCFNPDEAEYMDYYERVLYNQLVGSLNPLHYQTTYHYAVGLDSPKAWGNETPGSSCCGGTGSENHVKYQEATYFVNDTALWVGLYMPTTLTWDAKGIVLQQECQWPAEQSTIRILEGSARFALKFRVPYWATSGFDIKLNGQSVATHYRPSSYVTIPARQWSTSDVVEVTMPFSKHIDFGPDKLETAATGKNETKTAFDPMWTGTLMYGPLAMVATDVDSWQEATLDIASDLHDITANPPQQGAPGLGGNLYTLTLDGRTFVPDYYEDEHLTHYFRINLLGDPCAEVKEQLADKIEEARIFQEGNYKKKTFKALSEEIAASEAIVDATNLEPAQFEARIAALDAAIAGLKPNKKADKSLLDAAIAEAGSKAAAEYTWDSYETFQKALAEAREVSANSTDQIQIDRQRLALAKAEEALVGTGQIDRMTLAELLALAKERKAAQEAWNAMAVKVPEYAPWAPHAYARLMEQTGKAQQVYDNSGKNYNQDEVNAAAGALNAAINTMRPGNLPELEDLAELSPLLAKAKATDASALPEADAAQLKETIAYAEMVVKYVSDGSGTHDMIDNAVSRLKSTLNPAPAAE